MRKSCSSFRHVIKTVQTDLRVYYKDDFVLETSDGEFQLKIRGNLDRDGNGDGVNDNFLVSGGKSNQSDPTLKNRKTAWENAVMLRMIFKL